MIQVIGKGEAGRDWALWEFDFRRVRQVAMDPDARACHLTVLRRADAHCVHSPAFAPLLFDLTATDPAADRAATMSDLRLEMAGALLRRITQMKDETLASAPRV